MLTQFVKRLRKALLAATFVCVAGTASHAAIEVAGGLLVDLNVSGLGGTSNGSIWANSGSLGDFTLEQGDVDLQVFGDNGAQGVLFDAGDAFRGPTSVPTITGSDDRTIEVWSYQNGTVDSLETLIAWGNRGGVGGNLAFSHGTHPTWGAAGQWGAPDIAWNPLGGGPPANQWVHLSYVHSAGTTSVYMNGQLMNSENEPINTFTGTTINLGAQNANGLSDLDPGERLTGAIGGVRVHEGALSPAQLLNNFEEEKGLFIAPPPPAELVGLYRFDNQGILGLDSSGNDNHLTNQGDPTQGTGVSGGSASLDGVGDMFTSPAGLPTGLPLGNSHYSIAAWIKPSDMTKNNGIVGFGNYGAGGTVNALRTFGDNGFRHYWWGNDMDTIDGEVAPTDLDDGQFHHVVVTYDGETRRLYLNGVLIDSLVAGAPNTGSDNTFAVGRTCDFCGGGEFFNGDLDDVSIFSGALNEDQIANILSGDYSAFIIPEPTSIALLSLAGLVFTRRRNA